MLSKDAFSMLSSSINNTNTGIMNPPISNQNSTPMPTCSSSVRSVLEPLLEVAFPSSQPTQNRGDAWPSLKRARSDTQSGGESPSSSMYSTPTPSSSPKPPCSPRPSHSALPTPTLNFGTMPTLNPSITGPRGKPSSPLRSSIQKLRRMNSDAEKGGRGERRYLRLGREDSIALPGDESWLDEMDGVEDETGTEGEGDGEEEWDEAKRRRLLGDLLEDWEETTIMEPAEKEEEDECTTPTRARTPTQPHSIGAPSTLQRQDPPSPNPNTADDRTSSIWEDGEKFWAASPPNHPPNSPNKPKQRFVPLSSSPVAKLGSRKREFEVARDDAKEDGEEAGRKEKAGSSGGDRKRSALGIGTPNVNPRIQVCPPSGGVFVGTPGSLYDQDGFL
ncbi:hypothetical protein K505DRAFT_328052, partial [Melanomma pulvis-pyrius CBS 109.77]